MRSFSLVVPNPQHQRRFSQRRAWLRGMVGLGVAGYWLGQLSPAQGQSFQIDRAKVLQVMQQRYGASRVAVVQAWFRAIDEAGSLALDEQLQQLNRFWNLALQDAVDKQLWGTEDYWATPVESLGKGAGDCEDYVIGKYFSLLAAGVSPAQLRFIYVRARVGGMGSTKSIAHMVLGYYAQPTDDPLILDNLLATIRSARQRPDLTPVFSFNAQGVYAGGKTTSVERIGRWQNLLARMRQEGFRL